VCVSRKDYVRHPICKLQCCKTPYKPPVGEVESLSSYQKDYTCKHVHSLVSVITVATTQKIYSILTYHKLKVRVEDIIFCDCTGTGV